MRSRGRSSRPPPRHGEDAAWPLRSSCGGPRSAGIRRRRARGAGRARRADPQRTRPWRRRARIRAPGRSAGRNGSVSRTPSDHVAVAHLDEPERDPRQKAPVRPCQALHVHRVHICASACSSITRSAVWIEQTAPVSGSTEVESFRFWMVARSAPAARLRRSRTRSTPPPAAISAARTAGVLLPGLFALRLLTATAGYPSSAAGGRVPAYCYSTCVHDERSATIPASVRPVPGLPVDDLLASSHELARQWALALIAQLPLERIDEVPLDDLARGAPALCAQTLRALTSDAELSRLTGESTDTRGGPAPALELARISGADGPAGVTRAVEALRGVLWGALTIEMAGAHGRDLADTCDRLAHVCSCALEAVLRSRTRPAAAPPGPPPSRTPAGRPAW